MTFTILDGITALDFISVYNPISKLTSIDFMSNFKWEKCSFVPVVQEKEEELQSTAEQIKNSLSNNDIIVVPDGFWSSKNQKNTSFASWLEVCKRIQENDIGVYRLVINWK